MKRIIKVLVVSALMMVLMATSAVPAFADNPHNCTTFGYGCGSGGGQAGPEYTGSSGHVYGWACGSNQVSGYNQRYC
jgi:hypothetical protein